MADRLIARAPKRAAPEAVRGDESAHDPRRFARAFHLAYTGKVERVGPTQFKVAGNHEQFYWVDLAQDPPCTCQDQWWAGEKIRHNCKHALASKIVAQDPSVIPSLMELAYQRQQRADELERRTKRRTSAA